VNNFEKVLVVGLGLIGKQRLDACLEFGINPQNLTAIDINIGRLSYIHDPRYEGVTFLDNFESALDVGFDRCIVALPHDLSAKLVLTLLDSGIKVLLEKPLGRSLQESEVLASHPNAQNLSIGFNYRFMPGITRLKNLIETGSLGALSTLRMELGHGGGPKDQGSWKIDPIRAGGGVLLDPGIHLIDLLVYIFGANEKNFRVEGKTEWKGFWKTGIEESASFIGYVNEIPFTINTSIVAWRTRFKIEVIGLDHYFEIDGRGRTDGPQISTEGPRWGWQSHSSQKESENIMELATKDLSLQVETSAWLSNDASVCSASEALTGMKIYDKIVSIS